MSNADSMPVVSFSFAWNAAMSKYSGDCSPIGHHWKVIKSTEFQKYDFDILKLPGRKPGESPRNHS